MKDTLHCTPWGRSPSPSPPPFPTPRPISPHCVFANRKSNYGSRREGGKGRQSLREAEAEAAEALGRRKKKESLRAGGPRKRRDRAKRNKRKTFSPAPFCRPQGATHVQFCLQPRTTTTTKEEEPWPLLLPAAPAHLPLLHPRGVSLRRRLPSPPHREGARARGRERHGDLGGGDSFLAHSGVMSFLPSVRTKIQSTQAPGNVTSFLVLYETFNGSSSPFLWNYFPPAFMNYPEARRRAPR